MRTLYTLLALAMLSTFSLNTHAQTMTKEQKKTEEIFIANADEALQVMKQEALNLNVEGVGVVYFIPGNETQSWISKMIVVGASGNERYNYIAIANSKASEMAETLKPSGSKVRKIKVGELDFVGGTLKKIDSGYLLAAFSGATSEQDLAISTKVLDWFFTKLH